MKLPLQTNRKGNKSSSKKPSHLPEHPSVGIGTLVSFCSQLSNYLTKTGCRGIAGPFPPPLWIRAPCGAIDLYRHNIMGGMESQLQDTCHCESARSNLL